MPIRQRCPPPETVATCSQAPPSALNSDRLCMTAVNALDASSGMMAALGLPDLLRSEHIHTDPPRAFTPQVAIKLLR